jgi:Flp pilus assembly protein TadG
MRKLSLLGSDRGQALVEFALASVVFFMTIFGIIEFGRAVWEYNIVASLAKDGARYASLRGSTSGAAVSSDNVQTYLRTHDFGLNVSAVATWPDGGTPSNGPGKTVQVHVTRTFTPLTLLIPHIPLTLQSTAQVTIAR